MPQSPNATEKKGIDKSHCLLNKLPDAIQLHLFDFLDYASKGHTAAFYGSMFGKSHSQLKIILKLSQFISAGAIEKVASVLKIMPDMHAKTISMLKKELFRLAAFAEQAKIKKILELFPELLLEYAPFTDFSGIRLSIQGKGLTIFQHAIWARDTYYMCNMMMDCLPNNELGEKIRCELLRQFNELMEHGVNEQCEKQFSMQPLIDALAFFKDNASKRDNTFLCPKIGRAQKRLPANIWQHYCDPEESFKAPSFTKKEFIRQMKLNYGVIIDATVLNKLGKEAITRGDSQNAYADRGYGIQADLDLNALIEFDKTRNKNLKQLHDRLQQPFSFSQEMGRRCPQGE